MKLPSVTQAGWVYALTRAVPPPQHKHKGVSLLKNCSCDWILASTCMSIHLHPYPHIYYPHKCIYVCPPNTSQREILTMFIWLKISWTQHKQKAELLLQSTETDIWLIFRIKNLSKLIRTQLNTKWANITITQFIATKYKGQTNNSNNVRFWLWANNCNLK